MRALLTSGKHATPQPQEIETQRQRKKGRKANREREIKKFGNAKYKRTYVVCYLLCKKRKYRNTPGLKRNIGRVIKKTVRLLPTRDVANNRLEDMLTDWHSFEYIFLYLFYFVLAVISTFF